MGSNYKIKYNIDMVFCIDATGSMDNIIELVQNNALNLYQDVKAHMEKVDKHIDTLRVRVVAYRDYLADQADAMMVTDFFTLPQDADKLEKCMSSLVAMGGGDDPEDGLEALAYAIKSDWNNAPGKKRQVIVLWTDDDTHDLGYGKRSRFYPKGMAEDFRELTAWWGHPGDPGFIDQEAKRLVLFAPAKPGWKKLQNWDMVVHYPSEAGNGLRDIEYKQIVSIISQTV